MQSIARVTKLRRAGVKARSVRKRPACAPRNPGPLLKFIGGRPRMREPAHLAPVADHFERAARGEAVEVCISVPPRHGKTTLLVHAIVWILMQDPTAQILYASYAHGFAAKQVRKAMALAKAVGLELGDTRRRDEWNTAAGGFVKAAGVGGQITGEGFTLIVVDDPHKNRAEAESARIREGVVEGFRDDIYTRQDPRGTSVFVVHTRWHTHDLIGVLTSAETSNDNGEEGEERVEPFEYVNLPAVTANDNGEPEALAPELFSLKRMLRLKARVGEYGWASLYMGQPQPRSGSLFSGGAVLIEKLEESGAFRYAIGVDLARTARTRSDWNVAVVLRLHIDSPRQLVDVVEVIREQGTLTDTVRDDVEEGFARRLHGLQQRYPGARTVMYTGRSEEQLLDLLAAHGEYPCVVEGTPAVTEKYLRSQAYAAAWNEGRIRILRAAGWANRFVTEHVGFTGNKGGKDDQVDAAAAAFDALDEDVTSLEEAMAGVSF